MLNALMAKTDFPCLSTVERSTSRPATRRRNTTPMYTMASMAVEPRVVAGNIHWKKSGERRPRRLGPMSMPARISPTTVGRRRRLKSSPSTLPEPSMSAMPRKRTMMSLPESVFMAVDGRRLRSGRRPEARFRMVGASGCLAIKLMESGPFFAGGTAAESLFLRRDAPFYGASNRPPCRLIV